jgi:hypothetical protein
VRVGWYVHHHGSGHLQRFLAVAPRLPGVVGLSSLPRPAGIAPGAWLTLAPDAPAPPGRDETAGGALHWAPLGHDGLRDRMAQLAGWVARERPRAFVCDVSVEVALAVRLMGVPVVWIAQRGRRDDAPHQLAYRLATVVAPWTPETDSPGSGLPPDAFHVGALSRFDGRPPAPAPGERRVTVLVGGGGHELRAADVGAAARATPDWTWTAAGLPMAIGTPVGDAGRPDDPWPLLCASDVIVAAGGGNLIAEVAAARRPLVCLAQARPFAEQRDGADALARAGLAESPAGWPAPGEWPAVLARAGQRDPARWSLLHDGRAGERLVETIRACASA